MNKLEGTQLRVQKSGVNWHLLASTLFNSGESRPTIRIEHGDKISWGVLSMFNSSGITICVATDDGGKTCEFITWGSIVEFETMTKLEVARLLKDMREELVRLRSLEHA